METISMVQKVIGVRSGKKTLENPEDYERFLVSLGEVLTQIRLDLDITQGELAKRSNRKQPAIAKLENGPQPNVALRVIYEMALALELPMYQIIQLTENRIEKSNNDEENRMEADYWEKALKAIMKLSPSKKNWLGKVVLEMLQS